MLYYFPNRPLLTTLESEQAAKIAGNPRWDYEVKKNGDRLVLQKTAGSFVFKNRHKTVLRYVPPKDVLVQLDRLGLPDETHIDAELINNHTKTVKNIIYVYDIYLLNGKTLAGTLEERRAILRGYFKDRMPNVFLAEVFAASTLFSAWKEITSKGENEGVVLKNKDGKLSYNPIKSDDVWWQVKIRKPSGSYAY